MRLRDVVGGGCAAPASLVSIVGAAALIANWLPAEPAAIVRAVVGVATTIAMLLGARRHRCLPQWAWLVVSGGVGVWVAGDFLWDSLDAVGTNPASAWYVVANCLYLVTYPALLTAILGIAGGSLRGGFENAADSAIFALAAVVLLRMFAVDGEFTGDTLDTLFNAAFPLGDALLLGGIMWIFFTTGVRSPALWLLGSGMTAMLVTDVLWDLEARYALTWLDPWIAPAYPISYALIAATALHPSAARLWLDRRPAARYVHRARLAFLCATLALVSLVALAGNRRDAVLDVSTVVLVVVLALRFAALVGATERAYRTADRSERRFRALATTVPVGILEADPALRIMFANEEAERQLGSSPVGFTPLDLAHLVSDGADPGEWAGLNRGVCEVRAGRPAEGQMRVRGGDGGERWLAWYATPVGESPGSGAFLATVDITALKDAESMLSLQATHDALTGLPNRRLLYDRLSQSLGVLDRRGGSIAVLFLDLDRFKPVNDQLGHDAGDRLLKVIAGRIQSIVRAGDTVARVGGDEFVVVLAPLNLPEPRARLAAARVAADIIRVVSQPVELDSGFVAVAASVGIVLCQTPGEDPDGLLRDADAAMYVAKRGRGARYEFFDDAVDTHQVTPGRGATRHAVKLPRGTGS